MLYFGLHYRSFFILLSHSFFILYSTHSLIVTILSTKFSLIAQEVPFDLLQLFYVACERAIRQLTVSTVSIYIIIFTAINHTALPASGCIVPRQRQPKNSGTSRRSIL